MLILYQKVFSCVKMVLYVLVVDDVHSFLLQIALER